MHRVCRSVSVGRIFPLFLSVVWICRLALATHHGAIVCVCQRTPPLAVRYYELWRSEWLKGHTCGHRLADAACSRQSGACGARRMCSGPYRKWNVQMGLTCGAVKVRSDESACEGEEIVSSELRWYCKAGGQGGVLASGVLAAGYCCHGRVGWEGMKGPGLFM